MVNALNINSTVGIFFKDWVDIESGETLEYEVSLYEDADTDKVMFFKSVCLCARGTSSGGAVTSGDSGGCALTERFIVLD